MKTRIEMLQAQLKDEARRARVKAIASGVVYESTSIRYAGGKATREEMYKATLVHCRAVAYARLCGADVADRCQEASDRRWGYIK